MTTDTTERGLENLIVADMTARGWIAGDPADYDREHAVDVVQLRDFLMATQPAVAEAVDLVDLDQPSETRRKFLARLQGEAAKRGVVDVLRNGVKHFAHSSDLFYGTLSHGNPRAAERHAANRFSVTRQLRYFKQFSDNPDFKRWLANTVFRQTYHPDGLSV